MTNYYRSKLKLVGDYKPSRLFLAEGETEAYLLDGLLENQNAAPSDCHVHCLRGISGLHNKLRVIANQDNFDNVRCLCFMVDADDDAVGRTQSVKDGCRRIDFMNVQALSPAGTCSQGNKRFGLFVSPGDGNNGRIEDMILQEIAEKPEYACITGYIDCMATDHGNELDSKSVVQTYISAVNGSLCGAGRAFQAGILDPLDTAYESVRLMIENLL